MNPSLQQAEALISHTLGSFMPVGAESASPCVNNLRLQFTPAQRAAEKDLVVTVDAKSKMRQSVFHGKLGKPRTERHWEG